MKMSAKRESLLESMYGRDFVYCHAIDDRRSMRWLDKEGFIKVGFNRQAMVPIAIIAQKGIDYLKSQPAFR